ncbi:MAG: hypothetical protein KAR23_00230 [Candidatus Aenigmarchaeota archaeon]|nr:hypothetical protein [Candidatus Aenigmarchaeota archaeon]
MDLYDLIGNMQDIGFYDILLPWALFFAIVYGLLMKVGPFEGNKSIASIISMAIAFFAVAYTPFGMSFGTYLAEMFGKSGTILAGLLVLSLFLGMAGLKLPQGFGKDDNKRTVNFLIIVAIIAGVIYFTTGFDNIIDFGSPTIAEDTIVTILVILALAGGIYMMVKGDKGNNNGNNNNGDDTSSNTSSTDSTQQPKPAQRI